MPTCKKRRGAFWLSLLSLAWLQVSFAAHQFEHTGDFLLEDSCHACSHLDRVDDIIAEPAAIAIVSSQQDASGTLAPEFAVPRAFVRSFDSRGPPTL